MGTERSYIIIWYCKNVKALLSEISTSENIMVYVNSVGVMCFPCFMVSRNRGMLIHIKLLWNIFSGEKFSCRQRIVVLSLYTNFFFKIGRRSSCLYIIWKSLYELFLLSFWQPFAYFRCCLIFFFYFMLL